MAIRILAATALLGLAACGSVSGNGAVRTLTGCNPLACTQKSVTQLTHEIAATTHHGVTGLPVVRDDGVLDISLVRLPGLAPAGFSGVRDGDRLTVGGVAVRVRHARYARCVPGYDPSIHTSAGVCTDAGYGYVNGFVTDRGPGDAIGPGYSGSGAYNADGALVGIATALVTQQGNDELLVWYAAIADVLQLLE